MAVEKILAVKNLQDWIDQLATNHNVFAPVRDEDGLSEASKATYEKIEAGHELALDIRTTVSPKGVLFKQVEKILSYERNNSEVSINENDIDDCIDNSMAVLFGVRPCDARSFMLTDKPFVHSDMPEKAYLVRREHSAIITHACNNACKTCFCTSVGGSPVEKAGDVWMLNLGDRYLVEALTPRGEQLLLEDEKLFSDVSPDDSKKAQEIGEKVSATMEVLQIPSAEALDKLFTDEDFWKELTEKCLSCGACTFICPTCYCFDVRDEGNMNAGDRYRRWDSCMFFQYNRAAGGHNPRDAHWKRMRQRMLHKFCYFVEKYGDIDCVGCGRCIRSCPVSYDLRDFIKKAFAVVGETGKQAKFTDGLPVENEEPFVCEVDPATKTDKSEADSKTDSRTMGSAEVTGNNDGETQKGSGDGSDV